MPLDPVSAGDLSKLTTLMFAAALDQRRWPDFLEALSIVSGGVNTHLLGNDSAGPVLGVLGNGYDPEFFRSYLEYFGAISPWALGFAAMPVGEAMCAEWICRRDVLVRTEFYSDWVRPQEDLSCGGGAVLLKDASRVFVLGGNIRRKDQERLEARWLSLVELLVPHLQQAFEIARVLAGQSLAAAAVTQAGAEPRSAVLLVNEQHKVIFGNSAAEAMLATGDLLYVTLDRRIALRSAKAATDLTRAMGDCDERGSTLSSSFEIAADDKRRYVCRVARIDPSGQDTSPLGAFLGLSDKCILLTISAQRVEEDATARLVKLHGLTQSEAFIAERLAAGLTVNEIAETRAVSVHTVRNQVRSAMSRMDVRRQVDLVRLVTEARAARPS